MDKHGTRWQVATHCRLAAYVKFLGDADAASGKDAQAMEAAAADPGSLAAHHAWGAPVGTGGNSCGRPGVQLRDVRA